MELLVLLDTVLWKLELLEKAAEWVVAGAVVGAVAVGAVEVDAVLVLPLETARAAEDDEDIDIMQPRSSSFSIDNAF